MGPTPGMVVAEDQVSATLHLHQCQWGEAGLLKTSFIRQH